MVSRIALFGLCAVSCLAQSNTATVNGTILDVRGGVVAEASVIAVHEATGIVTAVKSNGVGMYSIPNLAVGDYKLTVEKPGFRRKVRSNLVLTTGQILEWNTTLELGPITESVNVTDTQAPVDTRTSDVTQLIDSRSIEALPLGNRRTMNIIATTGAAVFISNEDRPNYSLAGGRMQSQMAWIDGGTGQNIRIAVGFQTIDLPAEAVQEIKVLANNYPAEYGGSAGGVVIETTRSGTNNVHGSAYEYLRNDAMDAPGFFAPVSDGAKLSPELRYHVFGGTAGGPIRRNRTFFFASYEGTRRHTSSSLNRTVPTELQRRGDFSQTFNRSGALIPISDPSTATRQPFPGNIIPPNRLDPVALSVLNYFFHPNRAADNIAGGNNFGFNPVTGRSGEFAMGKADHSPNDRNRLTFRYMASLSNNYPVSIYPESPAEPGAYSFERAHYAYGSWTRILSSRQVNDLRYTYPNRTVYMASRGVGGNYPENLGLRGVDPRAFPQFAPAGFLTIGSNTQERRQYPIEQHQVVDNLTLLRNHHALKVGGEARFSRDYEVNLPTVSGAFVFDAQPTGLGNGSGGNGLASMLLGLPTSYSVNATQTLDRRSWYYSGFAHDEWMVAPGLTFNLGIRWEMDTPITDANRRMNGFDRQAINTVSGSPGVVKFAGVNGYPKRPYQFDWNNFAPRFGFAWKPLGSRNFVVRSGYGLFFAHPLDSGQPTQANLGFALSAKLVSLDNGITPPFYLRNGVPPLAMDALNDSFGAVPPGQSPSTAVSFFERNRVSGYSHQFNLTLQRQMAESFVVQAGILGNLARKLASANLNINQIGPEILGPAHHFQADRPFPQFTDVILVAPSLGVTNYYAGLFKVEKRLTHGWSLVSTYTWSKCLGNTSDSANPSIGTLGAENGPYSNLYNRRADYGPAENDIEHRFTVSSVYELPFGRGRRWLVKGISSRLAAGWTIGALATIQSGAPATAVTATGSTYAFPAGTQHPDVVRNPNLSSTQRSVSRWFDIGAFSQPANYAFGNEGMGVIRAYGLVNCDFALLRNFALTERARLAVRIEAFNAFNHTNLNPPGTIFDTPLFGAVTSAKAARQLQSGVRLVF